MFDSTFPFSYTFRTEKQLAVSVKGDRLRSFTADGKTIPPMVIPVEAQGAKSFKVKFGEPADPYLSDANTIVHAVHYTASTRSLECRVASFRGHATTVSVVSRRMPKSVLLNGKPAAGLLRQKNSDGTVSTAISFTAGMTTDLLTVKW